MLYSVAAVNDSDVYVWVTGQISANGSDHQVVLEVVDGVWNVMSESAVETPTGAASSAYPQAIATSSAGVWVAGRDRAGHSGYSTFVEAPCGTGLCQQETPDPTKQDNYLWGIAPVDGGMAAWAAVTPRRKATTSWTALWPLPVTTSGRWGTGTARAACAR